ncbi:hypothetical protein TERTU_0324 [Teredinibacter turnerae T7901]|uniref:Uncharacterized protein n=1 Tax=Teredinibacter turnerae (strain ATCC 39867 / T7901) TaxID=377629 RepID=C5BM67_TERTT|nr:hypothetical protein [Teredinibacter turnerae]ACR12700.1 hypothetical protein TERTU_0324 [Teredinibacter turnerae T7901]
MNIKHAFRTLKASVVLACLTLSFTPITQAQATYDVSFEFSEADSIATWHPFQVDYSAGDFALSYEQETLGITPAWQNGDAVFAITGLESPLDFTQAKIIADIKFDDSYFHETDAGYETSLARATVVLVDVQGRYALGEIQSPSIENKSTFTTVTLLQGAITLNYADAEFDITNVASVGVGLISVNYGPIATGLAQFDNIGIDLDGAAGEPTNLLDFPVMHSGWDHNWITSSTRSTSQGVKGKSTLIFRNSETQGKDVEIYHHLPWNLNLAQGRVSFNLSLPPQFETLTEGVKVLLVDAQGKTAQVYGISASELNFNSPVSVIIDSVAQRDFITMDDGFDLTQVESLTVTIELPAENTLLSGILVVDSFYLQLSPKFAKNFYNPVKPQNFSAAELYPWVIETSNTPDYESLHNFSASDSEMVATLNWQPEESEIWLVHSWATPVNLSTGYITQRFYIPARETASGMSINLEIADSFGNRKNKTLLTMDGTITGGWVVIKIPTVEFADSIDLNFPSYLNIVITRGSALGHSGVLKFNAPSFSAN